MPRQKNMKVWRHYRTLTDKTIQCKFCSHIYKTPNVIKMRQHLLVCQKSPIVIKRQLSESNEDTSSTASHGTTNSSTTEGELLETSTSGEASVLEFTEENQQRLTKLLAKAIYVTGSPLSMVEHSLWSEFYGELQPLYKLPSRKAVSTILLQTTYKEMVTEITAEIRSATHLHLQCDGWSNRRNEGVINFVISKPEPVFVKSLATTTHRHTSEYLKKEIQEVMEIYGTNKFVTLIGDNARNIQKAFDLILVQLPHVTPLSCAAHTINLLCHDILKLGTIAAFMSVAVDTIKSVRKSQILNSLLRQIIAEKGSGEQLKLPCKTRWGSHYYAVHSLQSSKAALQCLAVHEDATMMPADVKSNLLSEQFWKMVNESTAILEPIKDNILKLEGNQVHINDVYMAFKDIKSRLIFMLQGFSSLVDINVKEQILDAVEIRRQHCIKPIHLAAYLLDPRAQGVELEEEEEIIAMEFISEKGRQLNLEVMTDLANYRAREGLWGKSFVWSSLHNMNPLTWWKGICKNKPLSKVAACLLSAPCTSAATERTFSAHGNVHSLKRNRLTTERAAKLTYISYNWNLLHGQKDAEEVDEDEEPISSPFVASPSTSSILDHAEAQPSTSGTNIREIEFYDILEFSDSDSD